MHVPGADGENLFTLTDPIGIYTSARPDASPCLPSPSLSLSLPLDANNRLVCVHDNDLNWGWNIKYPPVSKSNATVAKSVELAE